MTRDFERDAWTDPLGRDIRCRHAVEIPVLGIRTRFESNAPVVVEIASDGLGQWSQVLDSAPVTDAGPVVVRVVVDEALGDVTHRRLIYRMPDAHRLLVTGPGVVATADASRLHSVAHVAPALVHDREHFRYAVLEALAMFHLSTLDRQPIHAAGLARDGHAVLMVGSAGVGKSTVTYAGLREGYRLLAEDMVWVQLRDRFAIWGLAPRIQLPVAAAQFFPELQPLRPVVISGGEEKLVVPVSPDLAVERGRVDAASVCLLSRGSARLPELTRATPAEIAETLGDLETGFDLFRETIGPAIDRLSRFPGWRLILTDDARDAVPQLHRLFRELASGGG
ncbi:MAG: hypothetical protein OER90_01905 [Gemmatimonadota bacterium]|nr:hypothetical protein [Gemmatimonadota bacterium]